MSDKNPYNLDIGQTKVGDFSVHISPDQDPESPREWSPLGTMVCWHTRYSLGDKDGLTVLQHGIWDSPKYDERWDMEERLEDQAPDQLATYADCCGFVILPLYLYDHSGLTISTGKFSCPWDSGQVGYIFMLPSQIKEEFGGDREKAKECLEAEVKVYDSYLRGDVYGFDIRDARGNFIDSCFDSCWGFYGTDDVIQGATEALKDLIAHPPFTALSDLEERMFARIVELAVTANELDGGETSARAQAELEAANLGIRVDPEKVS